MTSGERKTRNSCGELGTTCRLILVRHATAEGKGRFAGQQDLPLAGSGRRELRRICEKCAPHDVRAVYASDLRRAHQTAEALARKFHLQVRVRPDLREMHFGEWEGLSWKQIDRRFPKLAALWMERFPRQPIPGGEPLRDFEKRITRAVREVVGENQGGCALIVTHAGVIRFILRKTLGLPAANASRLAQDPGAVNVIDYFESGAIVRCINA